MTTQDNINNFGASNTASDLLILAAQTARETNNRIVSVATVNNLPDLSLNTIDPGTIFFVESLNIPVIAQIGCWTGLDNRELRNDFAVSFAWSWGCNDRGQLGTNTATSTSSPVSVVGGFIDWCGISAGSRQNLAVRTNGSAWAWGYNLPGRLGDNTTANRSSPVSVVGSFTNWCNVSTGGGHSLAVRTNGTAWAWGCNNSGELGDNTFPNKSSPVSVAGGFTDWCGASAGDTHSLAVRTNGSAWSWGSNTSGNLGDNTTANRSSPVSVVGSFNDWRSADAGVNFNLAVRTNGSAWAWGRNNCGQLGDNTTANKSSPVSVVGGFSDWCSVSAGRYHSLGIRVGGAVWAWGSNGSGRLGDGTTTSTSSPVSVVGAFADWCGVSAGGYHSLAVRTNGTAWAWGANTSGALGDNTTVAKSSPVSVVGGFTNWRLIGAGQNSSVALNQF
jgi:alpha-tubulin suppressor-like RCC1 family protein